MKRCVGGPAGPRATPDPGDSREGHEDLQGEILDELQKNTPPRLPGLHDGTQTSGAQVL